MNGLGGGAEQVCRRLERNLKQTGRSKTPQHTRRRAAIGADGRTAAVLRYGWPWPTGVCVSEEWWGWVLTLFVPVSDQWPGGAGRVGCRCRFDGACIRNKARVPGDWRRCGGDGVCCVSLSVLCVASVCPQGLGGLLTVGLKSSAAVALRVYARHRCLDTVSVTAVPLEAPADGDGRRDVDRRPDHGRESR